MIRSRRGVAEAAIVGKRTVRTDGYYGRDCLIVPISYIIKCKIASWLRRH
ncbi:MAG: hypothetical protein ACFFED_00515 [Candidatus Thorarchaeota archaeon]